MGIVDAIGGGIRMTVHAIGIRRPGNGIEVVFHDCPVMAIGASVLTGSEMTGGTGCKTFIMTVAAFAVGAIPVTRNGIDGTGRYG
jgi:hypothetical protein